MDGLLIKNIQAFADLPDLKLSHIIFGLHQGCNYATSGSSFAMVYKIFFLCYLKGEIFIGNTLYIHAVADD
jgi:hypothetical protein